MNAALGALLHNEIRQESLLAEFHPQLLLLLVEFDVELLTESIGCLDSCLNHVVEADSDCGQGFVTRYLNELVDTAFDLGVLVGGYQADCLHSVDVLLLGLVLVSPRHQKVFNHSLLNQVFPAF